MRTGVLVGLFLCFALSCVQGEEYWYQDCAPGVCIPQSVHLSLTGASTEMVVGWFTLYRSATSTVRYGTSPSSLGNSAFGKQSSYLYSEDNDITFFQHFTKVTNLQPSTVYYYECGDDLGGWSPVYNFTTPPPVGSASEFSFAVYGDMGIANSQYTQSSIIRKAREREIDFVFHIGDIGYADDYRDAMYEAVWDQWFASVEPASSLVPYMVLPGNHEYSCSHPLGCAYATNFTVFLNRFLMPYEQSGAVNNMWYSFNYGNVHFVAMDTETDYQGAPEGTHMFGDQMTWLEADLASAHQDPNVKWIIVGGHRPIYSSNCNYSKGDKPEGDPVNLQNAVEKMFHDYHVDVYVCGHVHSYERDYPIYQDKPVYSNTTDPYYDAESTVYIVSGAAGCTEGFATCWNTPQASWSAYREATQRGYGVFTVGSTTLAWEYYASDTERVIDSFTITKN